MFWFERRITKTAGTGQKKTGISGFNPGPEVLAQNRPEVEPGGTLTHSIVVHSVVQAVYRLDVWLLDEAGNFLSDDPFQSGKFAMFPSAGQ